MFRRTASSVWLLPVLFLPAVAADKAPRVQPNVGPDETGRILKALEPQLRELLKARKVPGASIAVVKDDRVVYLQGLGHRDPEKKLPMTPDTVCQIASVSKSFTGALACIAAAEGKLSLDESPKRLLPSFKLSDAEADRRLTIADLMTHSSGMPRTDQAWWSGRVDSLGAAEILGKGEPTFPFRYQGQYSNMMVETAGTVTAAAFGKPWADALSEKLLIPLGMNSTRLRRPGSKPVEEQAVGTYVGVDGKILPERDVYWKGLTAAGGLQSTARDLATWMRFHLNQGEVDGKRLLPSAALAEAHRPRFDYGGGRFSGLGWFIEDVRGTTSISHSGYLPGFETVVTMIPERRLGVAVLTNNAGQSGNFTLSNFILDRLVGKSDVRERTELAKTAGYFVSQKGDRTLSIFPISRELRISLDGGRLIRMKKVESGVWANRDERDPAVRLSYSPKEMRDGKRSFTLTTGSDPVVYLERPSSYTPTVSLREIMARTEKAIGAKPGDSRTLQAEVTVSYPSEAITSVGRLFVGRSGHRGMLELLSANGKSLMWNQMGTNPKRSAYADSTFRVDYDGVPSVTWANLAGYSPDASLLRKVELLGETRWKGEEAYLLRKTPKVGNVYLEYVSKGTYLPLCRESQDPWREEYSDYRQVDGVFVPFKVRFTDANLSLSEIRFRSAKMIQRAPHWAFYPPAPPSTPWIPSRVLID